eukprot:9031583-Pyramimonas_sp.AAC.1
MGCTVYGLRRLTCAGALAMVSSMGCAMSCTNGWASGSAIRGVRHRLRLRLHALRPNIRKPA